MWECTFRGLDHSGSQQFSLHTSGGHNLLFITPLYHPLTQGFFHVPILELLM